MSPAQGAQPYDGPPIGPSPRPAGLSNHGQYDGTKSPSVDQLPPGVVKKE